ncbi:MAG: indole-3-glycerol phosphate synthase TrpC [Planctomycetota bacterium]|nr:indole-3-glycerol phosphate synthase TrpC [Planctomycetota bacterium]
MDILEQIVRSRRRRLDLNFSPDRKAEVRAVLADIPPARPFLSALSQARDPVALIAEIKRRSPSRGELCPDLDPFVWARLYAENGAHALSVLTEPDHFGGSFKDLEAARSAVSIPALAKDFTLFPDQVDLFRSHGADAILLIVRLLDPSCIQECLVRARELGMTALVEIYAEKELEKLDLDQVQLLGVNSRDLVTFQVDRKRLGRVARMLRSREDILLVAESGIRTREDVESAYRSGARGMLVGESLVTDSDPGGRIRELLGGQTS